MGEAMIAMASRRNFWDCGGWTRRAKDDLLFL